MLKRTVSTAFLCLVLGMLATTTGCIADYGPSLGLVSVPIPLSPYFQKAFEDRFWNHIRYEEVPILGPITQGGPAVALDPPSQDEIMRALEKARPVQGGLPLLYEVQRNNVRLVVEPIQDSIDPPRVYPMVGEAQLHHAHYKCTIYFSEATRVGWPIPYTTVKEDAQEVIYIDHNHLHMVGNVNTGPGAEF